MALAAINVKKPREAQIWNCSTENPVLRILPDSNIRFMSENQAVNFFGLNLGVLRILLFQGRAESPMERLAQGKRSDTLGWVVVSKTIDALKGQKRGYCAFVSHTQCFYVFTLLPFQGVDIIFLFHIPRVPLRLPWATRSFGLSARLGCRLPWVGKGMHF